MDHLQTGGKGSPKTPNGSGRVGLKKAVDELSIGIDGRFSSFSACSLIVVYF